MQLIDTHAHPHMEGYGMSPEEFFAHAEAAGVEQVVCVGTDADDSQQAITFAREHGCAASAGLHPHSAEAYEWDFPRIRDLLPQDEIVAIGECGLDYYYENSPREAQAEALHAQINLAKRHDLPLIFHVRDAYNDFLEILDAHRHVRGIVHSFTGDVATMRACLERDLLIGLNGIVTFAKDEGLREVVRVLPLERMVLETDAPFLTPYPYRGKINHSAHVEAIVEFISTVREEPAEIIARETTQNARRMLNI